MKISEVIKMLEEAKEKHGDIEVVIFDDYQERGFTEYEKPENKPDRIVI